MIGDEILRESLIRQTGDEILRESLIRQTRLNIAATAHKMATH